MRLRVLAVACALGLAGCVTSHKTYKPPSDAKVKATQSELNAKVSAARDAAKVARDTTLEARVSAKNLIALGATMKDKLAILKERVPKDLIPFVTELQSAALNQDVQVQIVNAKVNDAILWNGRLEQRQAEEETARVNAIAAADDYASGAAQLATSATVEREYRIKAESQLLKQRIFSLLWKLGGGLLVAGVIVLVVLWWAGKLAFKFAK